MLRNIWNIFFLLENKVSSWLLFFSLIAVAVYLFRFQYTRYNKNEPLTGNSKKKKKKPNQISYVKKCKRFLCNFLSSISWMGELHCCSMVHGIEKTLVFYANISKIICVVECWNAIGNMVQYYKKKNYHLNEMHSQ